MGIGALVVRSPAFRRSTRTAPSPSIAAVFFPRRAFFPIPPMPPSVRHLHALGASFRRSDIRRAVRHACSGASRPEFRHFGVSAICSRLPRRHQTRRSSRHLRFSGSSPFTASAGSQPQLSTRSPRRSRFAGFGALAPLSAHGLSAFAVSPSALRSSAVHGIGSSGPPRCSLLLAARCRPYFPASQRTAACTSRFVRRRPRAALPILRPRKGIEPTRR